MSGVAGRSGPPGNDNAQRGRLWRDAIERALAKRADGDKVKALDELAEKFLEAIESMAKGEKPNIAGFAELGDRIDGKPKQQTELTGLNDAPLPQYVGIVAVAPPDQSKRDDS